MSEPGAPAFFEYRSKQAWRGLPVIHVSLGARLHGGRKLRGRARAVVAVGDTAMGVVAVGFVAVGVVAVGPVALGVVAVGAAVLGVVTVGLVAVGVIAVGIVALGVKAVWAAIGLRAMA